jgi:hypothetical protein
MHALRRISLVHSPKVYATGILFAIIFSTGVFFATPANAAIPACGVGAGHSCIIQYIDIWQMTCPGMTSTARTYDATTAQYTQYLSTSGGYLHWKVQIDRYYGPSQWASFAKQCLYPSGKVQYETGKVSALVQYNFGAGYHYKI